MSAIRESTDRPIDLSRDETAAEKRRRLSLTQTERLTFFSRLAAALNSGRTVQDFIKSQVDIVALIEAKTGSGNRYLLTEKPSPTAARFYRDFDELLFHGVGFADAVEQYPGVFPPNLCAIIRAAEKQGDFGPPLTRYVEVATKAKIAADNLKSALIYPACILVVAVVVLVAFVGYIIPQFATLFEGLVGEREMPALTNFTLDFARFFTANWIALAITGAAGGVGYAVLRKRPDFRLAEARLLLAVPVLGSYIAKSSTVTFVNVFTMLVNAGIGDWEASTLAADAHTSPHLRDRARLGADWLIQGLYRGELHGCLASAEPAFGPGSGLFEAIATWKDSGDTEVLVRYARFLEHEADLTRERLLKLIGPVSIAVLGPLVGFLVLSLYMPMFSIIGKMAR